MKCIEYIPKNNRGGLSSEFPSKDLVRCEGEIKKVWENRVEIDCRCDKCGKSFGKGFVDREKFNERFAIW